MEKIGLLTIHDTLNYGSLLQTYSLYKAVETLGMNIELIDYKCKTIAARETTYALHECKSVKDIIKSLMWHKAMQEKKDNFSQFTRNNMRLSREYTVENIREANNNYNTFLVGSDIVWGTEITGYDWTYFLDFVNEDKIKLAFSSSVGTRWKDEYDQKISKYLSRFNDISVREELAQEWIGKLGVESCVTCDPTMLWDTEFWKKMLNKKNAKEDPYVVVYMWTKDMRTISHAKEYAKKYGFKVKCQQFYNPIKGVENVKPTSLEDWISLIANAKAVFTASYHGLLYSLYFHKNVYYYNRENKSRMVSLGKELRISNRDMQNEFVEQAEIDYDYVDAKLCEKRDYSWNVLRKMLKKN